jgi:CheY-like chemotaxis protein
VSRYKHSSEGSLPLLFACRPPHVDDDEIICRLGTTILQSQGYEVLCAKDGFEGLAALKQSLPDVIISDLQMPKMNGFEFLSVVRKRFPQIPIIAISGEFSGRDLPESVLADGLFLLRRSQLSCSSCVGQSEQAV